MNHKKRVLTHRYTSKIFKLIHKNVSQCVRFKKKSLGNCIIKIQNEKLIGKERIKKEATQTRAQT